MKKFVILFIIILFLFSYEKQDNITVFSYIDSELYDNYNINFKECDLNTNNFLEKFEYLKNKDFKILEIVPYNNLNERYLFYTNDLEYVLNKFKNDYIDKFIIESKYTTNVCIKSIRINTSNYILNDFKNIIDFTY